ncbi:MAG TPA: TRIC cation channel family protein [Usitatibacter sp.]|jgi:uncharacterized membrane protein YeiH|nr:TRIC cation channel family protein [Usitatibacter sp.]
MALPPLSGELVLTFLEAAAVLASAVAGMIVASNKGMDLVGAYALACVNAFGGGTVRDLLLDNRPFYWMAHWQYLVAIGAICVPFVYNARMYRMTSAMHRRSVRVDAIGLALFTITGVGLALQHDTPLVVALLMGVVTGTMGGVLRDVVVNEVPDLFRPGGLYATAALAGAVAFVLALQQEVRYVYASLTGIATIVVLRLLSLRLGLGIPKPHWIPHAKGGDG